MFISKVVTVILVHPIYSGYHAKHRTEVLGGCIAGGLGKRMAKREQQNSKRIEARAEEN